MLTARIACAIVCFCLLAVPLQTQCSSLKVKPLRIPASIRQVPRARRQRVLLTDHELDAFEKQIAHEEMSHKEQNIHRRQGLHEYKICENVSDSNISETEKSEPACYVPGVQVSILYGEHLNFCVNCLDPHMGGSRVDMWGVHFGPMHYHVDGLVVYAVPNRAQSELYNRAQIRGHIALLDRCNEVPVVLKVQRAQEAGALAAIIIDDGRCTEEFDCGRAGKKTNDPRHGFAANDMRESWDSIHIPAIIISKRNGEKIRNHLKLETMDLPRDGGQQFVSILHHEQMKRKANLYSTRRRGTPRHDEL